MKPSGTITLLTDFGLADSYVGAMKGVLLRLAPMAVLVDLTHLVPRHDVVAGAFVLASAAEHFADGAVHLAVVDPGVGSERAAVAVLAEGRWLVGPNNGLLTRALAGEAREVVRIEQVPGYERPPSATFHGRDLFAPAAAHIAKGGSLADLGPSHGALEPLPLPPVDRQPGRVSGAAIHVDHFGNVVTNISAEALPAGPLSGLVVEVGGTRIRGLVRTYADVAPGQPCALVGSDGLVEVAVREGSAAAELGLDRGVTILCEASDRLAGPAEDE